MPSDNGLYAITDCQTLSTKELLERSENILRVGVALFQYRNKERQQAKKKELALALQALCIQYKTPFIVNDDLKLAAEIAADGLHLGRNDTDLKTARAILGDKIIGVSCYNDVNRAIRAEAMTANYVAFGCCFPSQTKPDASLVCIATLLKAKSRLTIPIVAIGGITPENGVGLVTAKVDFIAVVSGLFSVKDPIDATKKYNDLFKK